MFSSSSHQGFLSQKQNLLISSAMAMSFILHALLIIFLLITPGHHLKLVNGRIIQQKSHRGSNLEELQNCREIDRKLWAPDTDFSKLRPWDRSWEVDKSDRAAYLNYVQQKLRVREEIERICDLSKGVYSIKSRLIKERNGTNQGIIFTQSTELMMRIETPPHYSASESWEYAGSKITVHRQPRESNCHLKALKRMNCFERRLFYGMLSEPSIRLDEFSQSMKMALYYAIGGSI